MTEQRNSIDFVHIKGGENIIRYPVLQPFNSLPGAACKGAFKTIIMWHLAQSVHKSHQLIFVVINQQNVFFHPGLFYCALPTVPWSVTEFISIDSLYDPL